MTALRAIDRIDTAARFTQADAAALNTRFEGVETPDWLTAVFEEHRVGRTTIVSSFGAESAVLLHLIAQIDPSVPVLFLDTGKHFPETLAYRDELADRLGLSELRILRPNPLAMQARDATGLRWSFDPDGCCDMRKVQPLARALTRFDASFTGRKGFQASSRANLPRFELDTSDAAGRLKINPLIDWHPGQIEAYFIMHDLPRHPLVAQGYPSIGCSPCTRAVAPGEDARSGRWSGWDKVECGIHLPGEEPFL